MDTDLVILIIQATSSVIALISVVVLYLTINSNRKIN